MSSISVLQSPGLGTFPSAKPVTASVSAAPQTTSQVAADSVATNTYPSPIFGIDPLLNKVIIEYRNSTTGDVTQQIPAKNVVRLYELSKQATSQADTVGGSGTA